MMAVELDPTFLKALTLLHSRHPDSSRQLKALVQEVRDKQRGDTGKPVTERKEVVEKSSSKNVDRVASNGNGKSSANPTPSTATTEIRGVDTITKGSAYELVETVEELSSSSFTDNGNHGNRGEDSMEELTTEMMEDLGSDLKEDHDLSQDRNLSVTWQWKFELGSRKASTAIDLAEAIEELSSSSSFEPVGKKPRLDSPSTVLTKERDSPPANEDSNDSIPIDDHIEIPFDDGPICSVCDSHDKDGPDNCLVECHECHGYYHQLCHRPPVTNKDVHDPRLVWYCSRCTREMKREMAAAQKPTNNKSKHEQPVVKSIAINPFQLQKPSVLPFRRPTLSTGDANKASSLTVPSTSSTSSNNMQSLSGSSKSLTARSTSRPQEATMKSMKRLEMVKKRAKLQQQMRSKR